MSLSSSGRRLLALNFSLKSKVVSTRKVSSLYKLTASVTSTNTNTRQKCSSRDIHYLAAKKNSFQSFGSKKSLLNLCKSSFSSDGDRDLAHFLKEEIAYEEDNVMEVPKFKDFKIDMKDTLVILSRSLKGEKIEISFDVNDSINVDEEGILENEEYSEEDMQIPDIVSYPSFAVKIEKSSGETLHFNCTCNTEQNNEEDSDIDPDQPDGQFDIFRFDNVKIYNSNEGVKNIYEVETETMDGELYSMLMTYLLERGITGHFVNDLLDLSTALEHRHYLTFLKSLRNFVVDK